MTYMCSVPVNVIHVTFGNFFLSFSFIELSQELSGHPAKVPGRPQKPISPLLYTKALRKANPLEHLVWQGLSKPRLKR
jgi:hypothetical protein